MPAFDTSTPTITRKFSDLTFSVPAPFAANHALTANEATFLNSTLASVVGNAFSGDIRRAMVAHNAEALKAWTAAGNKAKDFKPDTDPAVLGWDMDAKFAAKFTGYELGVSNRGGDGSASTATPLDRMVKFIATEDLKARLVAKGFKVTDFYKAPALDTETYKSKWDELLAQNIEKNRERFTASAQSQLDAMAAADADDDILEGVTLPEAAPEAPADPAPAD